MTSSKLDLKALPAELLKGTDELINFGDVSFCKISSLTAKKGESLHLTLKNEISEIEYAEKTQFFRALSYLNGAEGELNVSQTPCFDKNGIMLDCSRNAVIKPEVVKYIIRKMALMGLNTLMLYTEDTYEVKNRPYFGYLRGRYTQAELKDLDDYADMFGIELVPCIQTLAHLERALHWPQIDGDIRDTDDILMVGEEKVYEFIEDMISAASACCRTKRIHIGMDEAWSLGLGNYRFKNGIVSSHKLMEQHLERVCKILNKYGLEPMMWSDMYIRAASKTGEYYDAPSEIPQDIIDASRADVALVYWDYYHDTTAEYETQLKIHRQFPAQTIFAGGVWTWDGPAPDHEKAFITSKAALIACKKHGIKEVFTTAWGDNGAEANALGVLPGLQLYAEFSYTESVNKKHLAQRFKQCTNESYESFYSLSALNRVPGMTFAGTYPVDTAKFLLFEDPLLPLFYKDTEGLELTAHYKHMAAKYSKFKTENEYVRAYFEMYKELCKALQLKCIWRGSATECIRGKNKAVALQLAKDAVKCAKQARQLKAAWHTLWSLTSKPFGFEVIDTRLSGLIGRFETAAELMKQFADGTIDDIETLSCEKLRYLTTEDGKFRGCFNWARAVSACKI